LAKVASAIQLAFVAHFI